VVKEDMDEGVKKKKEGGYGGDEKIGGIISHGQKNRERNKGRKKKSS
jgi:methylglyoxal synthase